MSEMELHIGTIKEVDMQGLTIEEWCKKECENSFEITHLGIFNCYYDFLMSLTNHRKYIVLNDKIYRIDDKEYEDDYIYEMYPNEDGSYSYVMRFYNGGTCLSECLEEKLNEK